VVGWSGRRPCHGSVDRQGGHWGPARRSVLSAL